MFSKRPMIWDILLEFNFSESYSLLVHSMLSDCGFRLDRKKGKAVITVQSGSKTVKCKVTVK